MRCHVNQSQNNKPPASPSPSWMNVTPRWRHCAATLHSQSKHLHSGTSLHTELGSCSRRIWDLSKLFTFPASNRHGNFEQFCFLISYLNYLYFSRFVVLIVKFFFSLYIFFFFRLVVKMKNLWLFFLVALSTGFISDKVNELLFWVLPSQWVRSHS